MIDHFTLTVPDLARSKAFYARALEPLGYSILMDFGEVIGFGAGQKASFWLKAGPSGTQPTHLAFQAPSRAAVDAFHAAALQAGARDNGAPGPRSEYHPNYYGAFVIELDGHPIEAVCHLSLEQLAGEQLAGSKVTRKTSAAKKSAKKSAPKKSAPRKGTKKSAPKKKTSAKRKAAPKKRRK